jgi:hypothetical protein
MESLCAQSGEVFEDLDPEEKDVLWRQAKDEHRL